MAELREQARLGDEVRLQRQQQAQGEQRHEQAPSAEPVAAERERRGRPDHQDHRDGDRGDDRAVERVLAEVTHLPRLGPAGRSTSVGSANGDEKIALLDLKLDSTIQTIGKKNRIASSASASRDAAQDARPRVRAAPHVARQAARAPRRLSARVREADAQHDDREHDRHRGPVADLAVAEDRLDEIRGRDLRGAVRAAVGEHEEQVEALEAARHAQQHRDPHGVPDHRHLDRGGTAPIPPRRPCAPPRGPRSAPAGTPRRRSSCRSPRTPSPRRR